MNAHTYTHTCTYSHLCTHMRVRTHTHTHTHTHTQTDRDEYSCILLTTTIIRENSDHKWIEGTREGFQEKNVVAVSKKCFTPIL